MMQEKEYKVLDETEELLLAYIYEDVYLIVKATREKINLGDFYGDPTCGFISKTNNWCIVGGSLLIIWIKEKIINIKDDELYWVYAIRQKTEYKVELLIDPWADNCAIWEFDVLTKEKNKIRDFFDYKDKEYTDNVIW
jgi:hypothetical protein